MRTTSAEHTSHRGSADVARDEHEHAYDNPRRRRDHHNDREVDDRPSATRLGPLRHGVRHVRDLWK